MLFAATLTLLSFSFFTILNPVQEPAAAIGNLDVLDRSGYHAIPRISEADSPSTSATPASMSSPSILGYDGDGEFSAQAALGLTRASQTSNIVNSKAYYDTSFRTSTSGTIKTVEIDFPPGTYVGAATLVEVVGLAPGKIAASGSTATGMKITYTVTNEVNVPALTNIRIQLANINNPQDPGASYTVTITTKDGSATTIDGPTATTAYNMKQIGTTVLADSAVTTPKINDDAVTTDKVASSFAYTRTLADGESGWNPDDSAINFGIVDPLFDVTQQPVVVVNLDGDSTAPIATCAVSNLLFEAFAVTCTSPPPNGAGLRYAVFNTATP